MTILEQVAVFIVIFFSAVGLALSGVAVGIALSKKYTSGTVK